MTEAQTTPELVERWRNQIEHARKHPDSPLTLGSLCHALSDAADHAERQATELDRLRAVVEAIEAEPFWMTRKVREALSEYRQLKDTPA